MDCNCGAVATAPDLCLGWGPKLCQLLLSSSWQASWTHRTPLADVVQFHPEMGKVIVTRKLSARAGKLPSEVRSFSLS